MAALSERLAGCLSVRETRFLALAAATMPTSLGEVLEIGSFKGKSTTLLAKSVALVGGDRVCAVDPLFAASDTVPPIESGENLPDVFRETIESNGVQHIVEFHQMPSQKLAETWDRPLRLLWIDGDHSYKGAMDDFENFAPFLQPGSVVAAHDVLHRAEGPIRMFCERILLSPAFGPCGMCGSIGWGQYLGPDADTDAYMPEKIALYRKMSRLIQFVALGRDLTKAGTLGFQFLRPLVPHGAVNPHKWRAMITNNLPPNQAKSHTK